MLYDCSGFGQSCMRACKWIIYRISVSPTVLIICAALIRARNLDMTARCRTGHSAVCGSMGEWRGGGGGATHSRDMFRTAQR